MEDLGLVLRWSAACQVSKNRAHQCGRPSGGSSQESSRCGSKYGAHDESRVVSRAMRKGLCIQPTFQAPAVHDVFGCGETSRSFPNLAGAHPDSRI